MSTSLKTRVELMFGGRCSRAPTGIEYASGRIVLLGDHLDRLGGRVLAAPTAEGIACAWGVRPDSRVVVWGMNAGQKDSFQQGQFSRSGRSWGDLARGACAHVSQGGRRLPGIDLMVLGDLPMGEGLASSAAYLVVLLRALNQAIGQYRSKWDLAEDIPAIEREWLGVESGSMDPYLIAALRPGQVLDLDCQELSHEVLVLPDGYALRAEATGVVRALAQTPYGQRMAELRQAELDVQAQAPSGRRLVDLSPEAFAEIADALPETSRRRARYVVHESARVAQAAAALAAGDMQRVGRLMDEGHESLRVDFESSQPVIDALASEIRSRPGVLGVRLQGAGWGGRLAVLERKA